MNLLHIIQFVVLGFFAGLYSAMWGSIKDSKYEGFRTKSFIRSIILGIFCGGLLLLYIFYFPKVSPISPFFIIFFAAMGLERQLTESYKGFVRVEDQKKYKIPTYIGFYGKILSNRMWRILVGFGFLSFFFLFLFGLRHFLNTTDIPIVLKIIIAGSVGGIYTSLGGANKDGPFEGFSSIKVWRSEIITVIFAFILFPFVKDWIILGYSAVGAERTVIEFYKTFILKKKPGKFK